MRNVALVMLLVAAPLFAQEDKDTQVDWVGDWDHALKQAQATDRPIMVCINSKDGEGANERAATKIYRDKEFVTLSRKFVMVVCSTLEHAGMFGHCKRFGRVTCEQHRACEKRVRTTYADKLPQKDGSMISPQHAFFQSNGKFMRRKEYELSQADLMKMMRDVLKTADPEAAAEDPDIDPSGQPLTEKEQALVASLPTAKGEKRRAAIVALVDSGKKAAIDALISILTEAKKADLKCDLLRALGIAGAEGARETIELLLSDKDKLVRSFAAVALERLALVESVPALIKRGKKEKDTDARRNMMRALGNCGGPAADKEASKLLLKALTRDKQARVRKNAAIALKEFRTDEGRALVKKKMEKSLDKENDREVRGGTIYSLTFVGDRETTLPKFEQLLEKSKDQMAKGFMRTAIRVLKKRGEWGREIWFLYREDRNDPARKRD
jgi:HEAT repeat protein